MSKSKKKFSAAWVGAGIMAFVFLYAIFGPTGALAGVGGTALIVVAMILIAFFDDD